MPPVIDEAVCIRQWDWSETSQTVSLLCRTSGLVRGLAKGSKRPKSAFSGGIELLTRGQVGLIARPSSELALITEWDLLETFPVLRRSLRAHHIGMYFADLVQHALHDHDPHPPLYAALVRCMRELADESSHEAALLRFQWAILVETGYKPVLNDGQDHPAAATRPPRAYRFFPALGGIVPSLAEAPIQNQAPPAPGPDPAERFWSVRPATITFLRSVDATTTTPTTPPELPEAQFPPLPVCTGDTLRRANRLLASYIRYVLGREPTTMRVLFGGSLPR